MLFRINVIFDTSDEKKVVLKDNSFEFPTAGVDVHGISKLAVKILNFFSGYSEKELVISSEIGDDFLQRLAFQIEIYNSVLKPKERFDISFDCKLEVVRKYELIKKLFSEYYHVVRKPVTEINCETLALLYREMIAKYSLEHETKIIETVVEEDSMLQAIYSVGKAGTTKPRLFIVEFGKGGGVDQTEFKACICGKGVCFDTGGVSLKPSNSMIEMFTDMGGSALGFFASLCYYMVFKKPLLYATGIVENFIGKEAYRPGDVINSYSGKKIYIGNTDAEGRVVLSDVLAYVSKNYKLSHIITLATLTGAARIVCGKDYCPYVPMQGEDTIALVNKVKKFTGEYLVALPNEKMFVDGYVEKACEYADICNITPNPYEGSHSPAHFLHYFIDKEGVNSNVHYTHFDIANYFETSLQKRISSSDLLEFMVEFIEEIN